MKLPFKQTLGAGAVTGLFALFCFAINSCQPKEPRPMPSSESFDVNAPLGTPTLVKCFTSIGCTGSSGGSGTIGGTHNPFVNIYGTIFRNSEGKMSVKFTATIVAKQ